jgi:hypothetical protein
MASKNTVWGIPRSSRISLARLGVVEPCRGVVQKCSAFLVETIASATVVSSWPMGRQALPHKGFSRREGYAAGGQQRELVEHRIGLSAYCYFHFPESI